MRYLLLLFLLFPAFALLGQKYADKMEDTIYSRVDEPPSFPNGDSEMYDYIEEKLFLNVPTVVQERLAQEGYYTLLKFVVDSEGEIHDVRADDRSTHFYLLDELEKIFYKMPQWKPGKVNGQPVNTLVYLELDMRTTAGSLEIKYHPLFPDSVVWVEKKMTTKEKRWAAIAAIAITAIFAIFIFSGKL